MPQSSPRSRYISKQTKTKQHMDENAQTKLNITIDNV